jgi:hypothetical protein
MEAGLRRGDQSQAVLSQLPGWATTDRFDIEAKTDGDPAKDAKDQMRLMMQSLLAERFGLVAATRPGRFRYLRSPSPRRARRDRNSTGPTFPEALSEQPGLKAESQKGPAEVLEIDHVDHPSGN